MNRMLFPVFAVSVAFGFPLLALWGWVFDDPLLSAFLPGFPAMIPLMLLTRGHLAAGLIGISRAELSQRNTARLFLSLLPLVSSFAFAELAGDDNLTREVARARRQQVSSVAYELDFELKKGAEDFGGRAAMDLELSDTTRPLALDFLWKKIHAVRANGKPVADYAPSKGRLEIPAKHLAPKTRIEIEYLGEFNREGMGFQRVVDPEDQAEYLYTDFEPAYAHGLFPCFDQPDLKAVFRVQVDAPEEWRVVANDLLESSEKLADGRAKRRFRPSQPISPYLFFLGAGPFLEWKDEIDDIPLYIWARKSLARYVDHQRIFETTKKGLRFYNEYFGFRYPFPKYGQIFVPEFSWGGMENPGAVTLNEANLFRGPMPQSRYEGRDSLILHEMAHMWFGDLVTMQWWNDLWLNESFASYLATVAQDRGLGQRSAWPRFSSGKNWGYWQDQLVTTHPIETEVPDVRSAKGNFDGITYSKGAASLQQLHFVAGEKGFREGLRSYFRTYAFGNATRENFIAKIGEASGQDLSTWTRGWLQTAGLNRVRAVWHCENEKLASFVIRQEKSASGELLPHRTRVVLYRVDGDGAFEELRAEDVAYTQAETPVSALVGAPCPDYVDVNGGDRDYALFKLDERSLRAAGAALKGGLKDPLARFTLWTMLAQMVRDAELSPDRFLQLAEPALAQERDEVLMGLVFGGHSAVHDSYARYLTPAARAAWAPRLERVAWERVQASAAGGSEQIQLFDFYVALVRSPEGQARLRAFLKGEQLPEGFELGQDRRWTLVSSIARLDAGAEPLIRDELARDSGTAGQRAAFAARVALPSAAAKAKYWKTLERPRDTPRSVLEAGAYAFHFADHPKLSLPYVKRLFSRLRSLDWKANDSLVEIYFGGLFPGTLCSAELLRESEAQLKAAKNLTSLSRRSWLESNDELGRCVKIRALIETRTNKGG